MFSSPLFYAVGGSGKVITTFAGAKVLLFWGMCKKKKEKNDLYLDFL